MAAETGLRVEVVYALPLDADVVTVDLHIGATVADAIRASGVVSRHPEIDLARLRFGVWGRRAEPGDPVHDGDRVEIYRPLQADPKEVRRRRAARGRTAKSSLR